METEWPSGGNCVLVGGGRCWRGGYTSKESTQLHIPIDVGEGERVVTFERGVSQLVKKFGGGGGVQKTILSFFCALWWRGVWEVNVCHLCTVPSERRWEVRQRKGVGSCFELMTHNPLFK